MLDDIRVPERRVPVLATANADSADEPAFEPPQKVADEEEFIDMGGGDNLDPVSNSGPDAPNKDPKNPKKNRPNPLAKLKAWWTGLDKKQKIIFGSAAAGVLIALIIVLVLVLHHPKPTAQKPAAKKTTQKTETPKPTTVASRLTGVQVSPEFNDLPITGIMIENSPEARPQSGLNQAGVVFEAVAEGGITRFLTLWEEAQPDYVGPVRSVRPYYLEWLQGFDAAIAHVGGSGEALGNIQSQGIKDLDQFYNGGSYQRISQRYAPHNVYTSLGSLLALEKSKGYNTSNFTGFVRKAEKKLATPTATSIDFAISSALYNPHYDYDGATNSYKRSEGGAPHVDERSGQQISPKVVIAIVVPESIDADGIHTNYGAIGSGTCYVFQDGGVTQGTWTKRSAKEQITFTDANGKTIALDPGQTWISVVGQSSGVSYK